MGWGSPIHFSVVLMFVLLLISSSVSSSSTCRPGINPIVYDLQLQCPVTVFSYSPIEMDGESLDRLLSTNGHNAYVAILFYASWCPFSMHIQPKFAALSSMYPQIEHLMVKQSSALPSVFSRYGVHGVPSILVANRTNSVRHHGPKDLNSLLRFYQRATGLDPVVYLAEDEISSLESTPTAHWSWNRNRFKDIVANEPYLASSLLFVFLKIFLYLCPDFASYLVALWVVHIPGLNLAIFGDLKQAFSKLKVSKIRNLHKQKNWFPLFIGKSRGR